MKIKPPGYLTESTVFEDPAIKYDNMGDVPATTIENYLVSYSSPN